jgi:TrmH family RNA methyltransferase
MATSSEVISSVRAAPVTAARRLHRHRERLAARQFLAEGPRAVAEALGEHRVTGNVVVELFCTKGVDVRHPTIVAAAQELGVRTHVVAEHVAEALSETRAPQGVIAVCTMPDTSLTSVLASSPRLIAILVNAADPGNAGTVIRSADAAGADAVVFAGETVDPYNGKCVRASAGSVFHLPVVSVPTADEVIDAVLAAGLTVLAADVHAETTLETARALGLLATNTAWVFGHEIRGLTGFSNSNALPDVRALRIPIRGRAESLNLATAAAVCLFASAAEHERGPASTN